MNNNSCLRQHLLYLLKGDGAHAEFDAAVKDFPTNLRGTTPKGASHTPWEVLEHLRIAQRDVLDAIQDPKHVSPEFPAGYWPSSSAPKSAKQWDSSVEAFRADFEALMQLVSNDKTELLAPLPNTDGQTIMRKVLMAADHNSYHLGEFILLRRLLGAWT